MTLENLDTVIGFVLIILLLSLLITSLVQLVGWALRLRESNLRWGVQRVLEELGAKTEAAKLAERVVGHPSVKPTEKGAATAIHFEEFVEIVKRVVKDDATLSQSHPKLLEALEAAPTKELGALAISLETELAQVLPTEVARVKEAIERGRSAALQAGAKVRLWFDTVMSRTTERFVMHTRVITVICAVGIAFGAQIDSVDLLRQLSQKREARARLVQMADPVMKEAETILAEKAAAGGTDPREKVEELTAQVKSIQSDLARTSLQIVPSPFTFERYSDRLLGMLMTAFFLALGAPFWFNTLRQLSNLRPILAGKVEAKDRAAG